jgi:molecular chaperone GrpE
MEDNRTESDFTVSEALETTGAAVAAEPEASSELQEQGADYTDLQRERDDYKDRLLRKSAEFDNFRKRIERERQAVTEAAAADLIEDLLPVMDDLERALGADAGTGGDGAYRRGVELIQQRLSDILRKRGVRAINAVGADFDPYYHEAVVYEQAPGRRDGEIIEEFRRGYLLGDRLLRASMVKVAKGEA